MDPETKILKSKGMIDYQEGSIISRILIEKETGTVTMFAFDAGKELSKNAAPFDALVHIIDGEADIFISWTKLLT